MSHLQAQFISHLSACFACSSQYFAPCGIGEELCTKLATENEKIESPSPAPDISIDDDYPPKKTALCFMCREIVSLIRMGGMQETGFFSRLYYIEHPRHVCSWEPEIKEAGEKTKKKKRNSLQIGLNLIE